MSQILCKIAYRVNNVSERTHGRTDEQDKIQYAYSQLRWVET